MVPCKFVICNKFRKVTHKKGGEDREKQK